MGKGQGRIDVPTLHVHGDREFCLGRARTLVCEHCHSDRTQVVAVDAAHHPSTQPADIARVVDAQWLHVYPSVEVKARSRPPRSSRHPLAAINLASPPSTQTSALDVKLQAVTPTVYFPSPCVPHPDPSDQNLHNRPPSVSYTIIKRRHVCRHHHQGSPSGH